MTHRARIAALLLDLYASGKITKQFVYKVAGLLNLPGFHGVRANGR